MKIIIKESQLPLLFLRRYGAIKGIIKKDISIITKLEEFCDMSYDDFVDYICWSVSDNVNQLGLSEDIDPGVIHDFVAEYFDEYLSDEYMEYEDKLCNNDPYDNRINNR
jgi:hypothetical protein